MARTEADAQRDIINRQALMVDGLRLYKAQMMRAREAWLKEREELETKVESLTKERDRYLVDIGRITENGANLLMMRVEDIVELKKEMHALVEDYNALVDRVGQLHALASNADDGGTYNGGYRPTFDGACVECVGVEAVPEHMRNFRCWRHTPLPIPVDEDGHICGDCIYHGGRCMLHAARPNE